MRLGIGGSLLLIAAGAILKFAITAHVDGVRLDVIGVILMIIGIVALVLTLVLTFGQMFADQRRRDIDDARRRNGGDAPTQYLPQGRGQ